MFFALQSACQSGRPALGPAYCLASVALDVPDAHPALAEISRLLHSGTPFRSSFQDIGHRVPRFSAAYLGVCVPSACSAAELGAALERVLNAAGKAPAAAGADGPDGIVFRASLPTGMCKAPDQPEPEDGLGAQVAR